MQGDMDARRTFLHELFAAAVAAVHPATCLVPHLPPPPATGGLICWRPARRLASMMQVAERHYLETCGLPPDRLAGLAVTRHGYGRPNRQLKVIEAGHPIPDAAGSRRHSRRWRLPIRQARTIWCCAAFRAAPPPTGSPRRRD